MQGEPQRDNLRLIKTAAPPEHLPMNGRADPKDISFIGKSNYVAALEDKRFVFGIKREDRKKHLYIIGKNGVGKSKLLELLMRQDIAYNYGLCLIDSEGKLINSILVFVPESRIQDVIVVDPNASIIPIFNPLQGVSPEYKNPFVDSLTVIFKKHFV